MKVLKEKGEEGGEKSFEKHRTKKVRSQDEENRWFCKKISLEKLLLRQESTPLRSHKNYLSIFKAIFLHKAIFLDGVTADISCENSTYRHNTRGGAKAHHATGIHLLISFAYH